MTDPSPGLKNRKVTYAASPQGIEKAEKALKRLGFWSKIHFVSSSLVDGNLLSRSTGEKFFQGQSIQLDSFKRICEALTLNWQEIVQVYEEEQAERLEINKPSTSDTDDGVEPVQMIERQLPISDEQSQEIKAVLLLEGEGNSINNQVPLSLPTILREYAGDPIKITDLEEGSLRLIIEGSQEDIEQLLSRFNSGEFTEVSGFPVKDVQILSESSDNDESNSLNDKWRLVQEIVSQRVNARNLSGADLSDANLRGANLSDADLINADLSGADLINADLSGANLMGANLIDADLIGANLSGANLRGAYLSGANLMGANLMGANLMGANLIGTGLSGVNLSDTHLSDADLIGAYLSCADLSGADLIGAYLSGADLSGARLSGANLSGANLSGAYLRLAYLCSANLSGANLRLAYLCYANLIGANLIGANLISTNLSGADLSGAYLRLAYLCYADLSGANLSGANLSGANLSGANLSGANLSGAYLSGANLSDANLSSVYLSGVYLSGADLSSANLSGANLRRANLSDANLSGADLSGADVEKTQFGANLGLTEEMKLDLKQRGAIFEDSPGARSGVQEPSLTWNFLSLNGSC
jgi:uncharacterized protein YjbI with pentapeptide repeats